jgi:hypothetical protein
MQYSYCICVSISSTNRTSSIYLVALNIGVKSIGNTDVSTFLLLIIVPFFILLIGMEGLCG